MNSIFVRGQTTTRHTSPVVTDLGVITHHYWQTGNFSYRHALGDPETVYRFENGQWELYSWGTLPPLPVLQGKVPISTAIVLPLRERYEAARKAA